MATSPKLTDISIRKIEAELQKRVSTYPPVQWGRKQTDDWDRQTNFIYHIWQWDELVRHIAGFETLLANYAVTRWFNFWSAYAVETLFCNLPGVEPNINKYDRLVDFSIHGIKFDHKTSVFPKKYDQTPRYAWENKKHLILWLYDHQSQEQRYHTANRLFIILYARDNKHWQLRAEIGLLHQQIVGYVKRFTPDKLIKIQTPAQTVALSDLIWCIK
jgi:hypothetical protein